MKRGHQRRPQPHRRLYASLYRSLARCCHIYPTRIVSWATDRTPSRSSTPRPTCHRAQPTLLLWPTFVAFMPSYKPSTFQRRRAIVWEPYWTSRCSIRLPLLRTSLVNTSRSGPKNSSVQSEQCLKVEHRVASWISGEYQHTYLPVCGPSVLVQKLRTSIFQRDIGYQLICA